jgi:hypothetical protein
MHAQTYSPLSSGGLGEWRNDHEQRTPPHIAAKCLGTDGIDTGMRRGISRVMTVFSVWRSDSECLCQPGPLRIPSGEFRYADKLFIGHGMLMLSVWFA